MRTSVWIGRVTEQFRSLPKRVQRELRRSGQRHADVKYNLRCKVVMNLVKGHGLSSIQRHLDCSYSTIQRVAERFWDEGPAGLVDRREDNGETAITADHEECLLRAAEVTPRSFGFPRPTWTLELFIEVLRDELGTVVSTSTMSRVLARLGISLKRPKPIVLCPWKKQKRQRRLRRIAQLLENVPDDEVVLYVDEVDIHLNPKIGLDWMLRGQQKEVVTPGQNRKRYLAGAFNPKTGELIWVEGERKDSLLFIELLWELHLHYPQARRIHVNNRWCRWRRDWPQRYRWREAGKAGASFRLGNSRV